MDTNEDVIHTEIAIVGGGPAGLSASIEARTYGAKVTLVDENQKPGGQLFKQIHKFFGSQEHHAGVRGYIIGEQLLRDCQRLNVEVMLETVVWGIFEGNRLGVVNKSLNRIIKADRIILATGASENPLAFPGWTLPGVMGAGAVQTMMNVHRVLPGKNALMIGSGNVGLIVAYQLLQAGANVHALIEALPRIGGYLVHAAKLKRAGVPILTSHTVSEARGTESIEEAIVVALDKDYKPITGSEQTFKVDLICIAVGMSPESELCRMAGCRMKYIKELGGHVPIHDERMETTVPGIYVAGDSSGIEEASTAIEEGRLAGLSAAESLGYISKDKFEEKADIIRQRLLSLRTGPFGEARLKAKQKLIQEKRC
jgi:thioredoxin reductase